MIAQQAASGSKALDGLYLEGGRATILPHGRVRLSADRPYIHERRGAGGPGGFAGQVSVWESRQRAFGDRRQGRRRLQRKRIHSFGGRRQRGADAGPSIRDFVEQAAREAIGVNRAKAVRILVMNPRPAKSWPCARNRILISTARRGTMWTRSTNCSETAVLTDAYEPGSTFKIVTTSSALDAGVTHVGDRFYCSGSVVVDGSRIHCWDSDHGAEDLAQKAELLQPGVCRTGAAPGHRALLSLYGGVRTYGVRCRLSPRARASLIDEARVKRVDIAHIDSIRPIL